MDSVDSVKQDERALRLAKFATARGESAGALEIHGGGSVEAAYGATTEEENPLEEETGLAGLATPERAQALKLGTSSENSPLSLDFWKARAPPDSMCARCGDLQVEVDAALAATRRAEAAKQAAEANLQLEVEAAGAATRRAETAKQAAESNLQLEVEAAGAATRRAETAKQAAEANLQAYKEWATHELRDMAEKLNRQEGESLKSNTKELTAQNHELKDLLDRLMDKLEKERDTGATEAKALVQATERIKTQEATLAALAKRIKAQESELSARKAEAGLRSTPVPAPHLSTGAVLPVSNVSTDVDLGRLTRGRGLLGQDEPTRGGAAESPRGGVQEVSRLMMTITEPKERVIKSVAVDVQKQLQDNLSPEAACLLADGLAAETFDMVNGSEDALVAAASQRMVDEGWKRQGLRTASSREGGGAAVVSPLSVTTTANPFYLNLAAKVAAGPVEEDPLTTRETAAWGRAEEDPHPLSLAPPASRSAHASGGGGGEIVDRGAGPSEADWPSAPPGTTGKLLDDGTPMWRQANAMAEIAKVKTQQFKEDEPHRAARTAEAQSKNLSVRSADDEYRVFLMAAMGDGTAAPPFTAPAHKRTYKDIALLVGDQERNYFVYGLTCKMTRRVVFGLATGSFGTNDRSFNFLDVELIDQDTVRTTRAVDFTIQKFEPRGDRKKFDLNLVRLHSRAFNKLVAMRLGRDYEWRLNAFLEHILDLAAQKKRLYTVDYVIDLLNGAWDKYREELSILYHELKDTVEKSPGENVVSAEIFFKMLGQTPQTKLPATFETKSRAGGRDRSYLAIKKATLQRHADYESHVQAAAPHPQPAAAGGGRNAGVRRQLELTHSERKLAYKFVNDTYQQQKGGTGEPCVKALTNEICGGDCGHDHAWSLRRPQLEAAGAPWEVNALILEHGGLVGEKVAATDVPKQIVAMRARAAADLPPALRAGAKPFNPSVTFAEVVDNPHPKGLEVPLLELIHGKEPAHSIFREVPSDPLRVLAEKPISTAEKLSDAVAGAVAKRLGPGTPPDFTAYVCQYVAERLGTVTASSGEFPAVCVARAEEALRRVAQVGLPALRKFARERLPDNRAGNPLCAYHVAGAPCLKVFAPDAGTDVGCVHLFGNSCTSIDHGHRCGDVEDQCLMLTFAAGAGMETTELRASAVAQAQQALEAQAAAPTRPMSAEGAFALSAAHDLVAGHSHDCHFPIFFWEEERRDIMLVLVKAMSNGGVTVDVLDLRADPSSTPSVHYCLMLDGHARSLHVPKQWQGWSGLKVFLRAAANQGVLSETYMFKGWREALEHPVGVLVNPRDRKQCELCGHSAVRPLLFCLPSDVAGRAIAADPFSKVTNADIMGYMRQATARDDEEDGGATQVGSNSVETKTHMGANSVKEGIETASGGGEKEQPRSAEYDSWSFEDIKKVVPSTEQRPLVAALLLLTKVDPGDGKAIRGEEGPARQRFCALFARTVKTWDKLIDVSGGSYMGAASCFQSAHMKSTPSTMDAARFEKEVAPFAPPELAAYGRKIQKEGVRLHVAEGADVIKQGRSAWPKAPKKEHEVEVMWELFKDFQRGGLVLATNSPKAIAEGRFDDVWASPLMRVDKTNMNGTLSDEGRIVHNQSWPEGFATNDATDFVAHPPSRPPTHRDISRLVVYKAAAYPGLSVVISKRDANAAFKRCLLQIASWRFFASIIRGIVAGIAHMVVVIWLTLTFGWCGSPGEYGVWPALIDAAHQVTAPPRPTINGAAPFTAKTFVDDGVLVEVRMGARLSYATDSYDMYLEGCLGEGAVNLKKLLEEGDWELIKIVWGILYNLTRVAELGISGATMSMPPAKLQKADIFMARSCWDRGNRAVLQNDVQKYAGNVLFWSVVVYPLRLVLPAIWAMLGGGKLTWAKPSGTPREQEQAWKDWDDANEFTRLIVRQRERWSNVFTCPLAFTFSPGELIHLPGGPEKVIVGGDASGSEAHKGDILAAIDHDEGTWHAEHMNIFAGGLGKMCGVEETDGMTAKDFIIFVKELVALVALVVQKMHRWTNKIVCAVWDNYNVVQCLATRWSRNRFVRYLLAILTRCEIDKKFSVLGFYIWTHNNHPADDISRKFGVWLHESGYDVAVEKMQAYLNKNPRWAHLRHEPMRKMLEFLTDEGHAMKSFALPEEAGNPNSLAYELAQNRADTNPWLDTRVATTGPQWVKGSVAVIELRAGLGQLAGAAAARGARVHGVVEADPVARKVLQLRFPGARVESDWEGLVEGGEPQEQHKIVMVTVSTAKNLAAAVDALQGLAGTIKPDVVVVACVDVGLNRDQLVKGGGLQALDATLEAGPLRLNQVLSIDINAAELGSSQAQQVGLFVYDRKRGWQAGAVHLLERRPTSSLAKVLRPAQDVPTGCRLMGTFIPRKWHGATPHEPTVVGKLKLGGEGCELFPGALLRLKDDATTKWRYRGQVEGGHVKLMAAGEEATSMEVVEESRICRHLVQHAGVVATSGVGNSLLVSSAAPAGPGNNVFLDDRLGTVFFRALLDDECFRLQGHGDDVYGLVREALPNSVERRAGLAGRGVAVPVAGEAVARAAAAMAQGSAPRRQMEETVDLHADGDRNGGGTQKHTSANIRLGPRGESALARAEADLFTSQLSKGTRGVYERGFKYWWIWRTWRDKDPYLRGGEEAFEDENELIKFYAYFGVVCSYAYSTLHTWLYGIQYAHIVAGMGDPLANKLRLRCVRKGYKRRDKLLRGDQQKLAATVDLLLEAIDNGGLDYTTWDDSVLAAALVYGFFKLRRSGEFLRKNAEPDVDKCVRVGDCSLARDGDVVETLSSDAEEADELIAVQRRSKVDQTGRGVATNTFVSSDKRLCVVAWYKHLVALRPSHFANPTNFLFTLNDGKVLSRDRVSKVLKSAAVRMGMDESDIDVISLRAGGASAMFHAGFEILAIQRRGRWASDCWKRYVHEGRSKAKDLAERMASAKMTLLGQFAR